MKFDKDPAIKGQRRLVLDDKIDIDRLKLLDNDYDDLTQGELPKTLDTNETERLLGSMAYHAEEETEFPSPHHGTEFELVLEGLGFKRGGPTYRYILD